MSDDIYGSVDPTPSEQQPPNDMLAPKDDSLLRHHLEKAEPSWRKNPIPPPTRGRFESSLAPVFPHAEVKDVSGEDGSKRSGDEEPESGDGEWREFTDCDGNTFDVWTRNFTAP